MRTLLERYEELVGKKSKVYIESCKLAHADSPKRIRDKNGKTDPKAAILELNHVIELKSDSPQNLYKASCDMAKLILGKKKTKKLRTKIRKKQLFLI